jgi:hypothetical protein
LKKIYCFPHIQQTSESFFQEVTLEMTIHPEETRDEFLQRCSDLFTHVMACTHSDMHDQKKAGATLPFPKTKFIDALHLIYRSVYLMDGADHPIVCENQVLKEAVESLRKDKK